MRSFFQDLMIKKLLTWYENFLLKGSLNSLLNPWENNFKLKFMTKSQVCTYYKQGLFTLAAILNWLQLFSLFWSQKVYIHINPQFYIQLLYRPHFGTWILPFGLLGSTVGSKDKIWVNDMDGPNKSAKSEI